MIKRCWFFLLAAIFLTASACSVLMPSQGRTGGTQEPITPNLLHSIWVFVAGATVGAVATVLADKIKRYIYRPQLEIKDDIPEKGKRFTAHSIEVTNTGKSVAKNCHCLITFDDLEEADLLEDKKIIKHSELQVPVTKFGLSKGEEEIYYLCRYNGGGSFRPVVNESLCWSPTGNPWRIDIFPGTHSMVDVCLLVKKTDKKPCQIQIPSDNGWRKMRAAIRKKQYHITITVAGENAHAEKKFIIEPEEGDITLKFDE